MVLSVAGWGCEGGDGAGAGVHDGSGRGPG